MVEYSVDTLVHLYDSLNDQIQSLNYDIADCNNIMYSPYDSAAHEQAQEVLDNMLNRRSHLEDMRKNVEILLGKILEVEVKGEALK